VPELPEVEVVRRGLAEHVVGHVLTGVEVLHPRPVRRHVAGELDFGRALEGRRVTDARRRGKYLWLPLDNGDALLAHLGMSGQLLVQPATAPAERHLRVRLGLVPAFGAGRGPSEPVRELRFVDQRMFGGLAVSAGGADLPPEVAHIARDPMDPLFDDAAFVRAVRARSSGVKRILLDQMVISGVGNIYADEALWRAGVHGERPGERLSRRQVEAVLAGVREVMGAALDQGGTSFDALYVDVNGRSGYFDRSLEAYGQEGRPCSRCGTPIVRVAFMNRSSSYCPRCQPRPRSRLSTQPLSTQRSTQPSTRPPVPTGLRSGAR
jgi:formamidopyrimidine-DNA glycosylase